MREEQPADDTTDDITCGESDVDIESLESGKAGGFKKHDGVAKNGIAAEDLSCPDDAVLITEEESAKFPINDTSIFYSQSPFAVDLFLGSIE